MRRGELETLGRSWAQASEKEVFRFSDGVRPYGMARLQESGDPSEPAPPSLFGWGSLEGTLKPKGSDLPGGIFARLTGPFASKTGANAAFYHTEGEAYADLGRAVLSLASNLDPNWHILTLAERVGLLLGCLRNYRDAGRQQVDLDGALNLEAEVSALLAKVRGLLPRPW